MNKQAFLDSFGHIADAPGGIDKLRQLILDLAIRGRLTERRDSDEPASELLSHLEMERARLVANRRVRTPKALPPLVDIDVPFGLPDAWEWVQLGQLAADIHYGMTAKASTEKAEPAFVRITDIKHSNIQWSGVPGCVESDGETDKFLLTVGDILVARSGSVGVSTVVRDLPRPAVFASYLIRIVPTGRWLSAWWPVVAGSGYYWHQVKKSTTGSAQQNINGTSMRRWMLPIPPVQEQQRIVEKVEDFMALCNELEAQQATRADARSTLTAATLHRVSNVDRTDDLQAAIGAFADNIDLHLAPGEGDLAALKRVRQTILDLAVRGRLTHRDLSEEPATDLLTRIAAERDDLVKAKVIRKPRPSGLANADEKKFDVPDGWEWSALGQLILFSDSGWSPACLPSVRSDQSQWAVLKVSAVSWGTFRSDEHKLLTPGLDPRPQIEVQDGDFLMSRANTAELVGRSVVVADPPPRLMLSDKHVRLRFSDRVTAEYVNLVNGSVHAREYYASVATGTSDSMRNITRDQILALPIPVPPLEEQRRIVNIVAQLSSRCDEMEQQLVAAKALRKDLGAAVVAHATSAVV